MPRDVDGLFPAWFRDPQVMRAFYLKMEFPGGTRYWTTKQTYPAGDVDNRDMGDGTGSHDWEAHAWEPGDMEQGEQTMETISDLTFGNEDNEFSDLMYLEGGIQGVPITVWCFGFANTPPHDQIGHFILFHGEGDRDEVGDQVRVSVLPFKHPMLSSLPRRRFTVNHGFLWLPAPNLKIVWGSTSYQAPTASTRQTGTAGDNGSLALPGSRMIPVIAGGGGRVPRVVPRGGGTTRVVKR